MNTIAINGRFMARRQTGQERFAIEVVKALDKICDVNQYELVVPIEADKEIELKNIKVVRYGKTKTHLWEQIDFARYIHRKKVLSLNLCTIQPIFNPGIVCIHDISYKINPDFFTTAYGKISALWHRLNYYIAMKKSPIIYTVTECSKREIIEQYNIEDERIIVVPNGWEHIVNIREDSGIMKKFPQILPGNYYMSIGSVAPNKNIKWVFEAAKNNPNRQFVIVGRVSAVEYGLDYETSKLSNVIMTGYLTDEELKYLLLKCKALIFPSIYEGFGIPPLEAVALGKPAIVAKASCMPEIFGDCVYYLDPNNAKVDVDELMNKEIDDSKKLLEKYCYNNAAKIIHDSMMKMRR